LGVPIGRLVLVATGVTHSRTLAQTRVMSVAPQHPCRHLPTLQFRIRVAA